MNTNFRRIAGCILSSLILMLAGHRCLAQSSNVVWAWGNNIAGQLGRGTFTNSELPGAVPGLTNITAFSAGGAHNLVLKADGTVWSWGANDSGQLGNGTFTTSTPFGIATPAPVPGLTNVNAVAGGQLHSLVLTNGGTVWSWGYNEQGQLGNGTYTSASATPAPVPNLTDVTAISCSLHNLALKSNGTVWAWGQNNYGQLGLGFYSGSPPVGIANPNWVASLTNVTAISAGTYHSLALKSDGTVWAWGTGGFGELGNGTVTPGYSSATPALVSGLTNVVAIAAGENVSLALKNNGTVWAWGDNQYGEMGNGTFNSTQPYGIGTPAQVPGLTGVVAISIRGRHILALKNDGTVWTWGWNLRGQLGNGTTQNSAVPLQVPGLSNVIAITSGYFHSLVLVSAPSATVSGTITLEAIVPNAAAQPLTLTFRPADNSGDIVKTISVGPNGSFSVTALPRTAYTLHIKGAKYLAKNVTVNTTNGSVSGVTAALLGGDANNDNSVDVFDLDPLIQAFNSVAGDGNWNPNADFDCDNSVDVFDLDLLIRNFNTEGDP